MISSQTNNIGPIKITFNPLKNMESSVGQKHYPAWTLEYTSSGIGETGFSISVFTIAGDKAFKITYDTNDPLKFPTYLQIFQKMLESFRITG